MSREDPKLIKCEHGAYPGWWTEHLGATGWNGPVSACECCGAIFGYINSVNLTNDGSSGQTWTTDRCARCGGHFVEW